MRILLVDDTAEIRSIYRDLLEDRGHVVISVETPMEGLAIALWSLENPQERTIGAVITDFNMPEMNGIEFLEALRPFNMKPRLFMISATVDPIVPKMANALGAQFFDKMDFKSLLEELSKGNPS